MDYNKFFSDNAKIRKPGSIANLRKYLAKPSPDLIWMAGGLPNPSTFPVLEGELTLRDGTRIPLPPSIMTEALQYGSLYGYPPLLAQLSELTQALHAPPRWPECRQLVTVGGQDAMAKAFVMMVDPGDVVVVPEPCYAGVFSELDTLRPQYVSVAEDGAGMVPGALRAALGAWLDQHPGQQHKLKVLYVNPNGSNPSGSSLSPARRREIYQVACEYDLIIIEDDPYHLLQFNDELPPSFLSLDTEGRVVRIDSFSKTVSAGLRVGCVTGPAPLLDKMQQHVQATVLCGTAISQVIISELLKVWGVEGFLRHAKEVREFYRRQKDAMVAAATKHLSDLCEWDEPQGGMFLWLKVPGVRDTARLLRVRGVARDVLLVPGNGFTTRPSSPCQYMRASYATVTPTQIDQGFKILAEIIREEMQEETEMR